MFPFAILSVIYLHFSQIFMLCASDLYIMYHI